MPSCFSLVRFFGTPWTVAWQTPLSRGSSKQEYWSGFPCPPPGDLPNLGIKPRSPASQADSLPLSHPRSPRRPVLKHKIQSWVFFSLNIWVSLPYMSHKYMTLSISTSSQSFLQVNGTTGRIIEIIINGLYWKFSMYQALWPAFLMDSFINKLWG